MANLYCAPFGQSARDMFCQELQNLPRGILVLPNSRLNEQVQRQYGVRSTSLDKLASKILQFNGCDNYKEINRHTQEIIVQEIVKRLLSDGKLCHFAKLAEKKGFVSSITSLIGQLSRSGVNAEELTYAMEAWDRQEHQGLKDKEITILYEEYCRELENHKWYDLEGKYLLALKVLSSEEPVLPWTHIFLSDFYTLDALKLSLVCALAKHCQVKIGISYEKNREAIFKAVDTTYGLLVGYFGLAQPILEQEDFPVMRKALLDNLWVDKLVKGRPMTAAVHTVSFRSREEEMRWVLTEVKRLLQAKSSLFSADKTGAGADDIVLVVRDFTKYSGLRKLADEYGVPISLPKTAALSSQPLTRFIELLFEAVDNSHLGAQAYFKLLESSLGRLLLTVDGEKLAKLQQEKYYKSPEEVRDRIKFEQEQGNCPEDNILTIIDEYITSVPYKAELEVYIEGILQLLEKLKLNQRFGRMYKDSVASKACLPCITMEQLQEMLLAKEALVTALNCLAGDYAACGKKGYLCSLQEWRQLFLEAVRNVNIVLAAGRQDGVLVTEAVNMQGMQRDYVFMLGMREGEFPSGKTESWLYDDKERELLGKNYRRRDNKVYNDQERGELLSLGIDMPNTASAYAEDAFFFASAVTAANKGLVLTWFEDDENGVSRYVEEVQKVFANVKTEKPFSKIPASANELYCLGRSCDEIWLKEQVGDVVLAAAEVDLLRQSYSAAWNKKEFIKNQQELMAAGELPADVALDELTVAEQALLQQAGRYNGVLSEALSGAIRKRVGSRFSPSALEAYAVCPFMFLGRRVWKQNENDDRDDMVNKLDEGNIYHSVMERFISGYLHRKLTHLPQEEQATLPQRLENIFEDVCAEAINKGSLVDNEIWQSEKPRILRNLQKWLDFELLDQECMPVMVPAATEWEFEIALKELEYKGSKVYLQGKIDRIDASEAKALVTDYKRTKNSAPSIKKLNEGQDMQMPIYMLAVEASFEGGKKLLGETYYAIVDGKRVSTALFEKSGNAMLVKSKNFTAEWDEFRQQSINYLKQYITGIYSGNFNIMEQRDCSIYCPLKSICRYEEMQQLEKEGAE